jgi:hypothetical protein
LILQIRSQNSQKINTLAFTLTIKIEGGLLPLNQVSLVKKNKATLNIQLKAAYKQIELLLFIKIILAAFGLDQEEAV